ncbi:chitin binding Peritrophin-A domain protein [Trichuris suis]|nr:chitin binding Peritrophin-A domain protein [Trichuris suis]
MQKTRNLHKASVKRLCNWQISYFSLSTVMLLLTIVLFISVLLMTGLNAEINVKSYSEIDCSEKPLGCYGTSNCSPEYFCCRGLQEPAVYRCSSPLVWDQKSRSCRWRTLTESCQERPKKIKRSSAPFIQKGERIVMKSSAYICRGRQNGRYANPESPCSSFFIICYDDIEYLVSCAKGYLFSSASESCLPADEIKECAVSMYIFGKYRREVALPKLTFSCIGRRDGNYENPSNPCSRRFFSCFKGSTALRFCPKQARFDKDIDKCNFPEYVRSCGGSTTTILVPITEPVQGQRKTRIQVTELPASADPTPAMLSCDDKDDGQYPDPEQSCSSRYFTCLSGFTFPRQCPPSLFFDPVMMVCTFRQYIAACGGKSTTTTATTTEEITEAPFTEITASEFNCNELPLGVYADPDNSCSQVFYTCVGSSSAVKMRCPKGTRFDERKSSCNFPSEMPECAQGSNKTTERTAKRSDEQHREEANRTFGYLEKPCSKFYYEFTSSNRLRKRNCNASLFFDFKTKQCLSRSDVASCSKDSAPTDDVTNRRPFDCKYLQNGNYLPPGITCPDFHYRCEDKKTFLNVCPNGWTYSMESNSCKPKKEVPECALSKMSYCEKKKNGFYQDLKYCSKFYLCLDGEEMSFDCDEGKVFDWRSKACLPVSKASPPCGTQRRKFHCKGKSRGYYAHPQDCTKYYFCKNGRLSLLECEEGMGYHPKKMQCLSLNEVPGERNTCGERYANALMANPDDPSEAILCIHQSAHFVKCWNDAKPSFDPDSLTCVPNMKKYSGDTKASLVKLSVRRSIEGPLFDCTKKTNGSYAPSESNCTSYFYECMNGKPFLVRCPEDMMFSNKKLECVELIPQSDCWRQVINAPCYNRASGFYPHPMDCSKYILCIDGRELTLNCPGRLVYDPQSKTCLPSERVDLPCGAGSITPPFFCDEEDEYEEDIFKDETDPTYFYRCTGGRPVRYACQEGYKFNEATLRCEIDDKLSLMNPDEKCKARKNGLYVDIRNCGTMILCNNGNPYLLMCKDEEKPVLNPETVSCVRSFPGCDVQ